MTDRRDPRIRALIVELAESSPPAPSYAELERLLDKPREGSPVPRGGFVDKQRRPHRLPGWVYGIAAALAVLLLIGGTAWLLGRPYEPPVITEPSPTTTEPSPTTTLVAPIQTQGATWLSYQFDPNQHPNIDVPSSIVSTDTGFLALDADHDLLASADGIAWTASPLPFAATGPVLLERDSSGDYWLVDLGSQTAPVIWRSSDGEAWTKVDTSAIGPPSLNGFQRASVPGSRVGAGDWATAGSSVVVSNGENALTTWRFSDFVSWVDTLEIELSPWRLETIWDADSRTLEFSDSGALVGRVTLSVVAEDPLTIEARDDDDTLVATVSGDFGGLSTDEVLEGIVFGFETDRVFLSEAGRPFEEVVVPWGTGSGIRVEDPFVEIDTNLVASENGFVAYRTVIDEDDEEFGVSSAVEAWVSEDGRTWVQAETPTFATDQVVVGMTAVLEREGVFLVGVFGLETGQQLWRSEAGLEWSRVAVEADGASVSAGESFWLMSRELDPPGGDGEHFELALWVSSDGVTWRELDIESADGLTDPAGGHFAIMAGNVVFVVDGFVGSDPPGERTMWVGRLNE